MGTFLKLAAFLWKNRETIIEVETAIRALVHDAKAQKAA